LNEAGPYAQGNRGLSRKSKYLSRQEFVVIGWTDPKGSRPHLRALLLGYYDDNGKLIYAAAAAACVRGRAGGALAEPE
jgi:ATP-dependent DNA ligase